MSMVQLRVPCYGNRAVVRWPLDGATLIVPSMIDNLVRRVACLYASIMGRMFASLPGIEGLWQQLPVLL
jgi:hypothetical protein